MSLCLKDIKHGGLTAQWIIDNLNYIIGYAICHLQWTPKTLNACRKFLAFVTVSAAPGSTKLQNNFKSPQILENLFYLENMKPNISCSSPFLENIPLKQDMAVLKLTMLFYRYYYFLMHQI